MSVLNIMKLNLVLPTLLAALGLAGCAANSLEKTWKSPAHTGGAVKKVAVIAVDERGMVRKGFENRFVRDLGERQQPAIVTYDLIALPDIKTDKEAAVKAFSAAGADSVLIVRLVSISSKSRQVEASPEVYVPVITGFNDYYSTYGWYDYYSVAFVDMGASWGSTKQYVYLDTSLHDLASGKRIWSTLTRTTLKDDSDRLAELDTLCVKVVSAMHRDGVVR